MLSISSQRVTENNDTVDIDWTNNDQSLITPQDISLLIFANLSGPESSSLSRLDGEQELILAFGEEELSLYLDSTNVLSFANIEHLNKLRSSDYLTLRLYTNGDEQNLLWQYAFGTFGLASDENRDSRIVTAANYSRHLREPQPVVDTQPDSPSSPVSLEALIDGANSETNPMRIWLNYDADFGEVQDGIDHAPYPYPDHELAPLLSDSANGVVDGMSDLVDFFPVYLDIESALNSIDYFEHTYVLKDTTESLNFFEAILPDDASFLQPDQPNTQFNFDALQRHPGVAVKYAEKAVTPITAEGVELSDDFLWNAKLGRGSIVMIEAKKSTPIDQPLPLLLEMRDRDTNTVVASQTLWIQARPVHEMFRQIDLTNIVGTRRQQDIDGLAYPNSNDPVALPDTITEADYFVFVHGFNVSGSASRGWLGETFKRLYRSGFNGRFVGVAWHGFPDSLLPDYHSTVYNAFVSSRVLAEEVPNYTSDANSLTIAGHSLGNMVVSNAMAEFGLEADRYFLIDAAVPMEAYRADQLLATTIRQDGYRDMPGYMREGTWVDYPEKVYASEWFDLFNADDPRRNLTWRNRFESVLDVAYNFYSPGEQVLQNPSNIPTTVLWEALWRTGLSEAKEGRSSWYMQAIGKGCKNIAFGLANNPCQGGWGNQYLSPWDSAERVRERLDLPESDPDALTDEKLAQIGLFKPFYLDSLYAAIDEGNELSSDTPSWALMRGFMLDPETTWQILASGVPERSFALGANSLDFLEGDIINGKPERNFNLHDYRAKRESSVSEIYWPEQRIVGQAEDNDWLHSDMAGIAYPYIQPFYRQMVTLIRTQESK
jgi:pimeloyl-ACP methyl ester carboxylesterase